MDYVEAFKNLRNNVKYGRKSPEKAALLLTIIEMYESYLMTENRIKYDDTLKNEFDKIWTKIFSPESMFIPKAYVSFWEMSVEDFWHVTPYRGKEKVIMLLSDPCIKPSEATIMDSINYVELDEDLFFLITLQSGRSSLKRVLLETYSSLTPSRIELLSESKENSIDYSVLAADKYKEIVSQNNYQEAKSPGVANDDIQERFNQLKEDIQYVFYIEYYSFLKRNIAARDAFAEICPSVFHLYDRITRTPVYQDKIDYSASFTYEDFLSNLKISLMSENGSYELIEDIDKAIDCLHNMEDSQKMNDSIANNETYDIDESEESYYSTNTNIEQDVHLEIEESTEENEEINEVVDKKEEEEEEKVEELKSIDEARSEPNNEDSTEKHTSNENTITEENNLYASYADELITLYFKQGYKSEEIAQLLKCSATLIEDRFHKLNLINPNPHQSDTEEEKQPYPQVGYAAFQNLGAKYHVENNSQYGSLFNRFGNCVFSIDGQLKIINGKLYRFKLKYACFTVKEIIYSNKIWIKGEKQLVAYNNSELYTYLNKVHYADQIADFHQEDFYENNEILVDEYWYDYNGKRIRKSESYLCPEVHKEQHTTDDKKKTISTNDNFSFSKLKEVGSHEHNSYNNLWMIALIELVHLKPFASTFSYDTIACMMIASAWELFGSIPGIRQKEPILNDCIRFLINESNDYMSIKLYWMSRKADIYEAIESYPMADAFEEAVDTLIKNTPANVLKTWLNTEKNKYDIIIKSKDFTNSCLYAIHPRKVNPYIEIHTKWKQYINENYDNLIDYFKEQYVSYLKNK